jgi:hypothetical protein
MKEKLVSKPREEESKKDVEAARERQKAEGSESFFDAPLQEDPIHEEMEEDNKLTEQVVIPKNKKYTEVRL